MTELPSTTSPRRLPALLLVAALVLLALVVATPTTTAATNCSDDPTDISVSVRPHVLEGLEGAPLVSSSLLAPFGDETDCQGACPGKPAANAWVRPGSLGTSDPLAHVGYCRLPPVLPLGLAHNEVGVDVDGSGGVVPSLTPT